MSMPSCIRQMPPRQRYPNGLTTGPDTGQISPLEDTPPVDPDDEESDDDEEEDGEGADAACAERIWSASAALTSERDSASSRASAASAWAALAADCLSLFAAASELWRATSWSRRMRTSAVRAAITRVAAATTRFVFFVFNRAIRMAIFALFTASAIVLS